MFTVKKVLSMLLVLLMIIPFNGFAESASKSNVPLIKNVYVKVVNGEYTHAKNATTHNTALALVKKMGTFYANNMVGLYIEGVVSNFALKPANTDGFLLSLYNPNKNTIKSIKGSYIDKNGFVHFEIPKEMRGESILFFAHEGRLEKITKKPLKSNNTARLSGESASGGGGGGSYSGGGGSTSSSSGGGSYSGNNGQNDNNLTDLDNLATNSNNKQDIKMDETEVAKIIFDIVNRERIKVGVSELNYDESLASYAMLRAEECEVSYSHTRPNGESALDEVINLGFRGAGENIAYCSGYGNLGAQKYAENFMEWWMNSPGHKKNILRDTFNAVGIGVHVNGETVYATQLFGKTPESLS